LKKIDSRTNPLYRRFKSLLSNQGIKEYGSIVLSGRKLIPEFLATDDMRLQHLLVSDPSEVNALSFKKHLDVIWLSKDLFDELDEAGTHFPLLIAETPPIKRSTLLEPPKGLEVVLSFSNPLNLGAALRSCEAFNVQLVTLMKECANPYLPKVLRSSSGSSLRVALAQGPSITELTDAEAEHMYALDMLGTSLHKTDLPKDIRIMIGEEGRGVPKNLRFASKVSIPIKPKMDSLNAVAATSIALYAYQSRFS
jgi:RNA methyltransferase, TrmH family